MMTHQPVKVVVEEIDSNYESYLACLKERNRQRELLKRKTEEDLEKERLEKGFQLYFNAATKYLKSTSRDSGVSRFNKRNRSAPNLPKQKNKRKSWGDVILPCSEILVSEQVQSSASSQCSPKTVNCPNLLLKATTSRSCKSNQSVPQLSYFLNDDHTSSLCNTNAFNYCRQEIHINGSKVGRHIKENFHKIDLIFDIFDNWGDRSWVGLNGFEVIVNDKNSVHIYPHTVNVCRMNSSHSSDNTLSSVQDTKLFKSSFTTTTLEDMWLTSLENLPIRINFSCMLNHNYLKGSLSLNIWNFANSNLPGVGVRKCLLSVIFEGMSAVLYDGILPKVSETSIENSITSIFLNIDDILHPEGIHTVTNSPENNSSEYLESSQTSHSDDTDTCHSNNNNNDSSTLKQDTSSKLNVWFPSSHLNKLRQDDENDLLSNVNEDLLNYSLKRIHMKRITNGREHMNTLLEESWSSLNFFNHFHEGRISLRNESYRKNNFHSDISEYSSNPMIDSSSISDCSEFSKVESGHLTLNSSSYLVSYEVEKQDDNNSTAYYPSRIDTKDTLIPELPSGHNLLIDIISTWGDLYYVGLTGIEIFTSEGVNIASFCGITANPSDINTLPGYGTDPRVVTNLIDGVNWTRDDTHMWLTPFTLGQRHFVEIKFPQWIKSPVALIRIWNYNKSRVHSYRGVKDMIIYLDNQPIFYGEISKASGLEFGEPEDFCETILFCTDNEILDLIGKNDILLKLAENDHANGICLDIDGEEGCNKRPVTGVSLSEVEKPNINIEVPNKSFLHTEFSELTITDNQSDFCKICFIEIVLLEPWVYGSKYIGLTGIEFLNKIGDPLKIKYICVNDNNSESSVVGNCVDNLLNSRNNTVDVNNMWYIAYSSTSPPVLKFYPDVKTSLFSSLFESLHVWNYNDRQLGYDYGCKMISVRLKSLEQAYEEVNLYEATVLLRQAPGHTDYPFAQTISLSEFQENETILQNISSRIKYHDLPVGFVYQFNIFSSWHDQFYVGLDGIQLLSPEGSVIPIRRNEIFAYPSSVNDLYPGEPLLPDVRTVDKLVDNVIVDNQNGMCRHCWLAPILPRIINKIFIVFNKPVCVAGIRLWNYTRTPERGVREFSVLVDDQILFRGYLPKSENHLQSNDNLFTSQNQTTYHPSRSPETYRIRSYSTVAFDDDMLIGLGEHPQCILSKHQLSKYLDGNSTKEIDVYDGNLDRKESESSYFPRKMKINQALRPTTCVTNHNKVKNVR